MKLEHHTGYCKNCKDIQQLERKPLNNTIHLLITIALGLFTKGIGSIIWIMVWFFLSTKSDTWRCSVCGHTNDEETPHEHKDEKKKINIVDILKNSYKIILGAIVALIIVFGFIMIDFGGDETTKNKETKKSTKSKNTNVQAEVTVEEQDTKRQIILKRDDVESEYCYLYDLSRTSDSISGSVNCKEGKLTMNFYDVDSKSVVDTQTINYKNYKFYIKNKNIKTKNFKFKVTTNQKNQQKNVKSILPTIQYHDANQPINEDICFVKSWRYSKYSDDYLVVDGKTSCKQGKITVQIFDENNNNIGNESDSIELSIFSLFFKIDTMPKNLDIKYTISK